jgi:hypothetical protein
MIRQDEELAVGKRQSRLLNPVLQCSPVQRLAWEDYSGQVDKLHDEFVDCSSGDLVRSIEGEDEFRHNGISESQDAFSGKDGPKIRRSSWRMVGMIIEQVTEDNVGVQDRFRLHQGVIGSITCSATLRS